LSPGVYVIESAQAHGASKGTSQAKESKLLSYAITLDSAAASLERINRANEAILALNINIEYNSYCLGLINAALSAYNNLYENEKAEVDYSVITNALNEYISLGITYIEGLINSIGTVSENSYQLIKAARDAYNLAIPEIKSLISNYDVLLQAEETFSMFFIDVLNDRIENATLISSIPYNNRTLIENALEEYLVILSDYENLDTDEQASIINIQKIVNGIVEKENMLIPFNIIDIILDIELNNINLSNSSSIVYAYNTYQELSTEEKGLISSELYEILETAYQNYLSLLANVISHTFDGANPYESEYFTIASNSISSSKYQSPTYNDVTYTHGYKMDSKGSVIFTCSNEITLVLVLSTASGTTASIKIQKEVDGVYTTVYTSESFSAPHVVNVDLSSGTYKIVQNSKESGLFYIEVTNHNPSSSVILYKPKDQYFTF